MNSGGSVQGDTGKIAEAGVDGFDYRVEELARCGAEGTLEGDWGCEGVLRCGEREVKGGRLSPALSIFQVIGRYYNCRAEYDTVLVLGWG